MTTQILSKRIITHPSLIVKDYDGNKYPYVLLKMHGYWKGVILKNLSTTHFADGTSIPIVSNSEEWRNNTTGACCAYENNDENIESIGLLYNWYVMGKQLIKDWKNPTDKDWQEIESFFGMSKEELDRNYWRGEKEEIGRKMKETLKMGMGGFRDYTGGTCYYLGNEGHWWSSTPNGSNAWNRTLYYTEARVYRGTHNKSYGFSVRCVRNFTKNEIDLFDNILDATKKADRTMIAAMAMQGLLSNALYFQYRTEQILKEYGDDIDNCAEALKREISEDAVEFADALIAELRKEEKQ